MPIFAQFPLRFEEAVARLVHHATVKQEELSQRIVSYFKDHFVKGEELFAIRDEKEAALHIAGCSNTAEKTDDCEHLQPMPTANVAIAAYFKACMEKLRY